MLATKTLQNKLLSENTDPENSSSKKLTIAGISFEKIQPHIRAIMEASYGKIKELSINDCDLRTFENFPKLPLLARLDVSRNSLQGNF